MNIRNTDTNEAIALSLVDPNTRLDFIADFLGGYSHGITYNREEEVYEADSTEIEWWQEFLPRYQAAINRVHELTQVYGQDVVENATAYCYDYDLEYLPDRLQDALDEMTSQPYDV